MTGFDNHAEVFHLGGGEATFLQFEVEVQFRHALEDTLSTFAVGFFVGREDKEVVHVDDKPPFFNHVLERIIHESLECGRGVGEPKEHHHWFEEAFMRDEGGLPLVTIFDANIVVPPADVKLSEQFGAFEFVDEVGDEGEWVGITGGVFIKVSIILTGAETAVFLFNEKEWGCLGGIQRTDLSAVKVFLEEVFSGLPFFRGQGVNLSNLWGEGVVEVDFMVVGSGWRDMVGGFFREDRSIFSEFGGKSLFGFHLFSGGG